MTALVGVINGNVGAMAADRQSTSGSSGVQLVRPKVRQVAPWLIVGWAGHGGGYAWLWGLEVTATPTNAHEAQCSLDVLAEGLRAWAKDRDAAGAAAMVLTPWGLGDLHPEGVATLCTSRELGHGTGGQIAMGAARHAVRCCGLSAAEAAQAGVAVAIELDVYSGWDIDVLTMEQAP